MGRSKKKEKSGSNQVLTLDQLNKTRRGIKLNYLGSPGFYELLEGRKIIQGVLAMRFNSEKYHHSELEPMVSRFEDLKKAGVQVVQCYGFDRFSNAFFVSDFRTNGDYFMFPGNLEEGMDQALVYGLFEDLAKIHKAGYGVNDEGHLLHRCTMGVHVHHAGRPVQRTTYLSPIWAVSGNDRAVVQVVNLSYIGDNFSLEEQLGNVAIRFEHDLAGLLMATKVGYEEGIDSIRRYLKSLEGHVAYERVRENICRKVEL